MYRLTFVRASVHALIVVLQLFAAFAFAQEEEGSRVVPTELCRGYWFVPIQLNEEKYGAGKVLYFIYDTGASSTYIDRSALERLTGLEFEQGDRIRLVDASAGDIQFRKLPARVQDLGHLSMAMGRPVDGILGVGVFRDFLLTLDPTTGQMSIAEGSLPRPDGQKVFSSRGRDERPWLKVRVGGKRVKLLVDTGAARTGISINDIDRFPLQDAARVLSSSVRLAHVEQHSAARLDGSFSLAGLTFEQPVIEDVPGTQLLGGEILQHFVMQLDQRNRRLALQAIRSDAVPPQPRFELGMGYRPTGEGWLVTDVYAETPADAAGLQVDDLVTAVDGARPDRRGCRSFDQDGQEIALTVRREGTIFEKTLVLKPVIGVQ